MSGKCLGPHGGSVWDMDADFESKFVVTACGDGNARLFEATTGKYIARMPHKGYGCVLVRLFVYGLFVL